MKIEFGTAAPTPGTSLVGGKPVIHVDAQAGARIRHDALQQVRQLLALGVPAVDERVDDVAQSAVHVREQPRHALGVHLKNVEEGDEK